MNENIPTTSLNGAKFTMSIVCVNPRDPKDKMEFRDVTELNNKLFDLKEQHDFYKSKWEDKNNNVFRVIGLEQQVAQLTGLQAETLNERNKAEAKLEEVSQEYRDATNHYNKLHDDLVKENARLKAEVERLDTLCKQQSRQHSDISCENIMLRKAGDAMAEVCEDEWRYKLNGDIEYYLEMKPHKIPNEYFLVQAWNAAKEGKQP